MGVYDLPQAAIRLVERSGGIDWWCSDLMTLRILQTMLVGNNSS